MGYEFYVTGNEIETLCEKMVSEMVYFFGKSSELDSLILGPP